MEEKLRGERADLRASLEAAAKKEKESSLAQLTVAKVTPCPRSCYRPARRES